MLLDKREVDVKLTEGEATELIKLLIRFFRIHHDDAEQELEEVQQIHAHNRDKYEQVIKELEEEKAELSQELQDIAELIRQNRPDCHDPSFKVVGRVAKLIKSNEDARKDFERRLIQGNITKMVAELPLQLYSLLCKKPKLNTVVRVYHKDSTGLELYNNGHVRKIFDRDPFHSYCLHLVSEDCNVKIPITQITRIEELYEETEDDPDEADPGSELASNGLLTTGEKADHEDSADEEQPSIEGEPSFVDFVKVKKGEADAKKEE